MKNIFKIILVSVLLVSSYVNANNFENSKNFINVKIESKEDCREFQYNFETKEDLYNANFDSIVDQIKNVFLDSNELCEGNVEIEFTVSVGAAETYTRVTIRAEVSCENWVEELKKMKEDVEAVLNQ